MRKSMIVLGLYGILGPSLLAAQAHQHPDTGYSALQQRGQHVMGVDQYSSVHHFESLPDGGRISLERASDDSTGTAMIREHLQQIAHDFAAGNFNAPMLVHATGDVPGTRVMIARKAALSYTYAPLPRGGELRIRSADPEAVAAVHQFLAFQRTEHRTGE
ncbi:MAG: hypothetical protein ABJD11_06740 [Gemmatimonadota bacterium]